MAALPPAHSASEPTPSSLTKLAKVAIHRPINFIIILANSFPLKKVTKRNYNNNNKITIIIVITYHATKKPDANSKSASYHHPRKFFSSEKGHETELQQEQQDHHDHRHQKARRKLQIGFASLSTLPFSSPPQQQSQSQSQSQSQHPHSPTLDPRTTILLTALRGSVLSLDCPSPPAIDGRTTPSSAFRATPDNDGAPCWHANR
eukprot:CAMPEP_0171386624 /NCGR_PEP_ID=MMETSP0879-20121228/39588_1 /TAXON_ID=67004 /ORGANISM="Thalassiosira weissflogii, Strain CCMP1336" /LENGTH=203 /DNA_ID=CAMNT_0011898943 /DNA_START=123 /DNA_END=730 /DNA_ORIENTATION=-